jgi:hypothetical protein
VHKSAQATDIVKEAEATVRKRIQELTSLMENEPKTLAWKLRARVGEKVQWYELPERDREVVDSRIRKEPT